MKAAPLKEAAVPVTYVGFDLGYYQIKIATSLGARASLRSMHGQFAGRIADLPRSIATGSGGPRSVLETDKGAILFGSYAEDFLGAQGVSPLVGQGIARVNHTHFLHYAYAALGGVLPPGVHDLSIVYGLPVSDFADKNLKTAIKRRFCGDAFMASRGEKPLQQHEFVNDRGSYHFIVSSIRFKAQPEGTLWAQILNKDYHVNTNLLDFWEKTQVLVVDIGGGTTDVVPMVYLLPTMNGGTVQAGMNSVYANLKQNLKNMGLPSYTDQQLKGIAESGIAFDYSKSSTGFDVSEAVQEARDVVWARIESFLQNNVNDDGMYQHILVTGGGGAFFFENLQDYFRAERTKLVEDAPMANAVGFLRFGVYADATK